MVNIDELVIYRDMPGEQILREMMEVFSSAETKTGQTQDMRPRFFDCVHALIELAGTYGFAGNLWHNYLTLLLVNHENVFSTACEICGVREGSLLAAAKHDFSIIMQLYTLDFSVLEQKFHAAFFQEILHYRRGDVEGKVFNRRIRDRICELSGQLAADAEAGDLESFLAHMTHFYKEFGVGKFGLHKAFRVDHTEKGVEILPITNIAHVKLSDLVGYELQKKKLIDNTEAFIHGKTANNCLLFGDAGTGKSSSIKGILNQYYDQGLRMIEIYKHQFKDLNEVIAQIKNRNYRFIIYMDDLSFEEYEVEYKYLKAVIEGGLEKKPENVLIYATSNRRHLIREQFSDNVEGDIGVSAETIHASHGGDQHISDTVQEKLSLSSRFGVTIYFGSPDKKQFQEIVRTLAKRNGITMPEDELLSEANKWELSHGGLSGRTAQQFVDYILGMQ